MCNLDATDATCDAPGANDDASGTAVSIELARVMSKRKFDATIIFMTVPGEEQGLLGSTYFAKQAADEKDEYRGDVHQRHRRRRDDLQKCARPPDDPRLCRGRAVE